ncbi:MAG: alpha/beta fold hydrolase, partial [Bacteroidota bacterium]
ADDLRDFMDDHGIYQAHLVGHSMGGKVVMQFAADYPERIIKLVVADMAPKAYQPHHTTILEALTGLDLARIENRKAADQWLAQHIPTSVTRQFLLKSLRRTEENGFAWKFNLSVIYRDYPMILKEVEIDPPFEGPSLFLYGGQSSYLTSEDPSWIEKLFPEAIFECIEEAGHWLHAEAPTAFQDALLRFLL